MHANVHELMSGELGQWLNDQSTMRANALAKAISRWKWGGSIALLLLVFLWIGTDWSGNLKAFLSAGAAVAVAAWAYQPIAEAARTIKIGINSAIARSLGISYDHDVEPGAEFEAAKTYGLVPSHDRHECEDRWFGALEGRSFSLYEAHLEERQGSGKNRRWVTVFRGAIIDLEFGRSFHSTTLLQRRGKHKKWFGLGGAKDSVKFKGHQLDYVDQVHPAFDEVFEMYTDDQVEARMLVHPSYVEHLLALETAFQAKAIRALFARGQVILAVVSGDLFESGSINPVGDAERAQETAEQFAALANLALAINQNQRGRAGTIAGPADARDLGAASPAPRPSGFGRKGM